MAKVALCLVVAFVGLSAGAEAPAPFGISLPASHADVKALGPEEVAPFMFAVTPPRPHPDMITYVVMSTPKAGLCRIRALTDVFENDRHGRNVTIAFEKIRAQVEGVYGKSRLLDHLGDDSIWTEPGQWMMAVMQGDRFYGASWEAKHGSKVPSPIRSVTLYVNAIGPAEGRLILEYNLENDGACDEEKSAAQRGAF